LLWPTQVGHSHFVSQSSELRIDSERLTSAPLQLATMTHDDIISAASAFV
jgi:hypothetical protein